MQLLPAIDILNGKCVRLKQGDYGRETVYADNPAEMAQHWVRHGAEYLHVVDLDGAKKKEPVNRQSVYDIVKTVEIPVEIGGGIRNEKTIRDYLDAGIDRVVIGTLALKNPDWFQKMSEQFPNKLVLGIDARNGLVATEGWLETSRTSAVELARNFCNLPLAALVYTDIAKDGMMEGPNFDEMVAMQQAVPFPVIASGGVSSLDDIRKLRQLGLPACIIGKALYEGTMQLKDALNIATALQ
ncbi:MAG: 1-(5-phosphoribosyl)-5-[(5-phosphoribosylamino)methylideneamino]imidazole-4-carboxamide isomerase [Planctomycetaceae bacterium]|jgi:phosphoribosylformimino-5-aminoimidazole carboxamide ribotide isomerase|nr:1-(5-phosphoribosyl)-5-[(5-phosphoribosylamino)methylideneamino]imidazole-4-carboxamide isomerase [Planctomycetaceae bacterium]